MARTRKEIYDEIIAEKNRVQQLDVLSDEKQIKEALSEMAEVQSGSKVAVWRLWLYIVSYCIWLHEQVFDAHKAEVNTLIASAKVHTAGWYAERMLEYQHGDLILLHPDTKQPYYEVVDESKQVVKSVAVTGRGYALVKVKGVAGRLSTDEAQGAEAYLREIQEPGAQLALINLDSDKLTLYADLYYEPELDKATVEAAVRSAVETYISGLDFNGILAVSDLVDYVKDVAGVRDFYITVLRARPDIGTYEDVQARYYPASGWMELEDYNVTPIADV
ncbi:hypothetical protein V6R21_19090 [Limibacter armeniacum]|uniref:hypothetical protein n=1 Tax=Limibacter armeniacum TaxID=466084 RepID=UPI002FE554F9